MPTAWFQQTDAHDEPRQRWHLDIHVDPAVADQRIDAALAAGGVLVSDAEAPSFTILADAGGQPGLRLHLAVRGGGRSPDANIRDGDPACWDAGGSRMTDLGPGGYRGRMCTTLVRTRRED